jgi:vesicle coat complex subunit
MRVLLGFATMMCFGIVPISLLLLPMLALAQPQRPLDLPALPSNPPAPLRTAAQEYKELIPGLIDALKDEDSEVRQYSALSLAAIGREALPRLIEVLRDPNTGVRSAAAYAIGRIGPQAREAIPLLVKALKDPEAMVKRTAAEALSRLLGPDYGQVAIESFTAGPRMTPMMEVPSKLFTPEPKPGTPK